MRNKLLLLLSILFFFASCEKDEEVNYFDYIDEVLVTDDNNKLRNNVEIKLKRDAAVQIEYWKTDDASTLLKTALTEPLNNHSVKLVLLEPNSDYNFRILVKQDNNDPIISTDFTFKTRSLPENLSKFEAKIPDSEYKFKGYIHVATKWTNSYLYLLNSNGTIVWYESVDDKAIINSSFDPVHNTFQCIVGQNPNQQFGGDEIRVVDLYGNIVLKKTYNELKNPDVHHDIQRLANGDLIMINNIAKEFDLSSKGGTIAERVNGEGLTIMDIEGNVKWEWDCFSVVHPLDYPFIMDAAPDGRLSPREDLMHANSISLDTDGNYLMTHNRLNQLWKINSKTGELMYTLGVNGDIEVDQEGLTSGIHSSYINFDGEITILDNGKSRKQSRALSFVVDETNKKAEIKKAISFPRELFSPNQASAYMMDYNHILFGSSGSKTIAITDMDGTPVWQYQCDLVFYRAYYIEEIKLD
uniref:aryl-sulfate sulfotransferase n=1 Tax=uncultured Draconibacterium sp. TaxID=1573823 RepID=UPI0032166758